MTKESILFNRLDVSWFELKASTTSYWVIWHFKTHPCIRQKISKEEYEFLLKEDGSFTKEYRTRVYYESDKH